MARGALVRLLQILQRWRRLDSRPEGARLVPPKAAETGQLYFETIEAYAGQSVGELVRLNVWNIANEAYGDVIIVWIDPVGA
jgi:hypothetical protein